MKLFGKTKDGVIDDLLRAYVSRPTNARQTCSDFDPDLANAYIERSLTGASRGSYEAHLSQCAACRQNVVALTSLAAVEASLLVSAARREARPAWAFSVKDLFGWMSAPQWAMAAAAVIVLAISLPLMLSRNQVRFDKAASESIAEQPSTADDQDTAVSTRKSGDVASSKSEARDSKLRDKRETGAGSVKGALASNTRTAPAEDRAASEQARAESKPESQATDEVQRKSQSQVAAQAPPQTGTQALSDSDNSRQQQRKDAAQSGESGKRANEQADQKEKVARAEAVTPPPSASGSERGRARGGLRQPGAKLALRDSESSEAVRPSVRKVSGKKFSLKDGTWTDKDFDPEKDLPVVTIIRDSNVYTEVLAKRPKLKPYLTEFSPTERAIIVYKGTVYKLIPQQSDK